MEQCYPLEVSEAKLFAAYVRKTKDQIERSLSAVVSKLSKLNLHSQIEYSVLGRGKRLRPLLAILSAESVGGDRNKVMPLALAFEFIHTATLVHDDIIDQDETRRNKPALHKKWSVDTAILTGDTLIALAVHLASPYGEQVMKSIAQSAVALCDGEHIDITSTLKTATEELCLRRIREKSASLFKAAAYCGAIAAGGTTREVRSLAAFGENIGVAYQLKDDLLDLVNNDEENLKDLRRGIVTLPLIHSYRNSTLADRLKIEAAMSALASGDRQWNQRADCLLETLQRKGSFEYCEKKTEEFLRRAAANVGRLENHEYRTYLLNIVRMLKTGSYDEVL